MTAVWAKPGALARAARAGLLVLDVDGVLLDPKPSFYAAAIETARRAASQALGRDSGPAPTLADVAAFKAVGGWNDDFDLAVGLTWGVLLRELRRMPIEGTAHRSSGGRAALMPTVEALLPESVIARVDARAIIERSASFYAGRSRCRAMYGIDPAAHPDVPDEGLWTTEPVLATPFLLQACGFDLAFFTGRNAAEAELAAERLGLTVPTERRMVDDGKRPRKPAPDGLLALAPFAHGGPMVYVGDTIDDQHAANAYRAAKSAPELLFVRVFPDGAAPDVIEQARATGADVTADGLDDFLRALPARDRRDDG